MLSLLISVVFLVVLRTGKTYPGFKSWTLGFLGSFLSMFIFSIREYSPVWVSVYVGYLLTTLFYIYIAKGMAEFGECSSKPTIVLGGAMLAIQILGLTYSSLIAPSSSLTLVIMNSTITILFIQMVSIHFKCINKIFKQPVILLPIALVWYIAILVGHIIFKMQYTIRESCIFYEALIYASYVMAKVLLGFSLIVITAKRFILDLQDSMGRIETLEGLMPVCSCCKKIRDDEGYWNHVDTYFNEHSHLKVSHSICPNCQKELYGEDFVNDDDES